MGAKRRTTSGKIQEDVLTAHHEAGHVVSRYKFELSLPHEATIVSDGDISGRVRYDTTPPWMTKELIRQHPEMASRIREQIEHEVISSLCGYVAEARRRRFNFFRPYLDVSGAMKKGRPIDSMSSDLFEALEHLEIFESDEEKRQTWLLSLLERTWKFVGKWRKDIERVAEVLLEHRTVDGEVFTEMFSEESRVA